MQHATERVERPGESQEALDEKKNDIEEFKAKCRELRRFATTQEQSNPVSFALENSWTTTLKSDKLHFLEHTTLRMT